jgi:hypothetical protein
VTGKFEHLTIVCQTVIFHLLLCISFQIMLEVNTIVNDSKLFMQNFVNFILLKAKALSISP